MIRDEMKEWKVATQTIIQLLAVTEEEKREQVIERVDHFLSVRDQLQPKIRAPFTEEEEDFGQELILLDQKMNAKLSLFMKAIKSDIQGTQSKKTSVKQYVDPYNRVARDGTYFDTKQ